MTSQRSSGLYVLGGSSQLHDADLSDTNLEGTRFEGAIYNAGTKFPEGFDPAAHGMVLSEGPRDPRT